MKINFFVNYFLIFLALVTIVSSRRRTQRTDIRGSLNRDIGLASITRLSDQGSGDGPNIDDTENLPIEAPEATDDEDLLTPDQAGGPGSGDQGSGDEESPTNPQQPPLGRPSTSRKTTRSRAPQPKPTVPSRPNLTLKPIDNSRPSLREPNYPPDYVDRVNSGGGDLDQEPDDALDVDSGSTSGDVDVDSPLRPPIDEGERPLNPMQPGGKDLTPCQKRMIRKSWIKCDRNGNFKALQCNTRSCFCVKVNGEPIGNFYRSRREFQQNECRKLRTQAAKDVAKPDEARSSDIVDNTNPDSGGDKGGDSDSKPPETKPDDPNNKRRVEQKPPTRSTLFGHPGVIAAIIGASVVGLLLAILLVMFLVYRIRKRDQLHMKSGYPDDIGRSGAGGAMSNDHLRSKQPMLYRSDGVMTKGGPGSNLMHHQDDPDMYAYS